MAPGALHRPDPRGGVPPPPQHRSPGPGAFDIIGFRIIAMRIVIQKRDCDFFVLLIVIVISSVIGNVITIAFVIMIAVHYSGCKCS